MISADQIRNVVSAYLADDNGDRFEADFVALSYNIHKTGDAEAVALSRALELKMADLRSNCISLPDFKAELLRLITPEVSIQSTGTASVITGAGLEWPVEAPSLHPFEDRRFAWV